ncbi:MAG: hypothetical protein H6985_20270 [Pseudomonadales bacterium]|nr:hypothetical protein [Pseudomonadales bacterium]
MSSETRMKKFLLALCIVGIGSTLTACGGSSSNVSPGNVVVPPDGGGTDPTDPTDPTEPPPTGGDIASIIPASLSNAIYDSGETAPNGKAVFVIDVTALPGGKLDPAGLLLGNDYIFRIQGGALRIAQN